MSETAIVKPEVERLQSDLLDLTGRAGSLVVKDRDSCLLAKQGQRDVRAYMRDVHSKLDPFVEAAKRNLQTARDELNRWLDPAQAIDDALARKVKDYETQERLAAEAEQRKVNEERRRKAEAEAEERRKVAAAQAEADRKEREKQIKAQQAAGELKAREAEKLRKQAAVDAAVANQRADEEAKASVAAVVDVIVKPDIPTVAGVPSRRTYKAECINERLLIDAWASATGDKRDYLRQFITVDQGAINREAKLLKDSKRLESLIPGTHAWEE